MNKTCLKCGQSKNIEGFPLRKYPSGETKYRGWCKKCCSQATLNSHKTNPAPRWAAYQRWYAKNHEKEKLRRKEYRKKNIEADIEYRKKYRLSNKDKLREYHRKYSPKWQSLNKDRYNAWAAKRRAALINAVPVWASLASIETLYSMARSATQVTGIEHHIDHIVPLQGKNVCGLHVINNLRMLSSSLNRHKSNKWPIAL